MKDNRTIDQLLESYGMNESIVIKEGEPPKLLMDFVKKAESLIIKSIKGQKLTVTVYKYIERDFSRKNVVSIRYLAEFVVKSNIHNVKTVYVRQYNGAKGEEIKIVREDNFVSDGKDNKITVDKFVESYISYITSLSPAKSIDAQPIMKRLKKVLDSSSQLTDVGQPVLSANKSEIEVEFRADDVGYVDRAQEYDDGDRDNRYRNAFKSASDKAEKKLIDYLVKNGFDKKDIFVDFTGEKGQGFVTVKLK